MTRTLVVPAAGRGSRLQSPLPKLLTPVLGRPMIDHVLERHAPFCGTAVLVVHPAARADVERHVSAAGLRHVQVVEQARPTGMLDAVLAAAGAVARLGADRVWITWCDQVAISAATVARLDALDREADAPALALPTVPTASPYIHFDRDAAEQITGVRQRREGDRMPARGESDAGLFSLSASAFRELLPAYAAEAAPGRQTGERNFLPFVPWLAARARVASFPLADPIEAIGINTPEDLARIARHLQRAGGA
jgi:bifunctional UDP-N-acetylglucosamine pyrophosphorylase / glucosamine-1-phosphate N-acetyltransferase